MLQPNKARWNNLHIKPMTYLKRIFQSLILVLVGIACLEKENRPKNVPKAAVYFENIDGYMVVEDQFDRSNRTVWDRNGILVSKTITKNGLDRCIVYYNPDGTIHFVEERKIGEVDGRLVDDCSHF